MQYPRLQTDLNNSQRENFYASHRYKMEVVKRFEMPL